MTIFNIDFFFLPQARMEQMLWKIVLSHINLNSVHFECGQNEQGKLKNRWPIVKKIFFNS